ncbi:MAG TPA: LLM class flavin-dependent oxidoreductase [Anaerolineae bacterium]
MKIGLVLPMQERSDTARRYTEIRGMALQAEELGFDSIWLSDHLLYRLGGASFGTWECWTCLAALAQATYRIALGTLVTSMGFRNPALLAKMATTLDEISEGRFTLGIGAGWHEPEFTAFGIPFDHRASRLAEALQIIRPLLKTGHVNLSGQYYQALNCELRPRGPTTSGLPLLLGGSGQRLLRLAAEYADLWNSGLLSEPTSLEAKQAALVASCASAGRDPAMLGVTVHLPLVYPDRAPAPLFLREHLSGSDEFIAERWHQFAHMGVAEIMVECFPNDLTSLNRLTGALRIYRSSFEAPNRNMT